MCSNEWRLIFVIDDTWHYYWCPCDKAGVFGNEVHIFLYISNEKSNISQPTAQTTLIYFRVYYLFNFLTLNSKILISLLDNKLVPMKFLTEPLLTKSQVDIPIATKPPIC